MTAMMAIVSGIGTVWAVPYSLGGGLTFGNEALYLDWDNGRFNTVQKSIGGSLFFDAHYASLSVDVASGNFDVSGRVFSPVDVFDADGKPLQPPAYNLDQTVTSYSATLLNANLVGKFPLSLYGLSTVRVFPMLGVGYQLAQIVQKESLIAGTYNGIRLLFGLGGDFDLSDRVFLRLAALPYYSFAKESTKGLVKSAGYGDWNAHGGFGASGYVMVGFRLGRLGNGVAAARPSAGNSAPALRPAALQPAVTQPADPPSVVYTFMIDEIPQDRGAED